MHICSQWTLVAGSFAEYQRGPEFCAIKLPKEISYEEGAILEPLGVASHTVQRANIKPGDFVVVIGCGPIGIWTQKLARLVGATVVAIGNKDYRISFSRNYTGATEVIDARKTDPVERVKKLTDGKKADVVIEMAGSEDAIKSAINMVGRGGRIVFGGIAAKDVPIPLTETFYINEIDLMGMSGRLIFETWERVLRLVSTKTIDVRPLITKSFSLKEAEKAFELLDKGDAMKIQLVPQ